MSGMFGRRGSGGDDGGGRSAADREAAFLERQRRRAEREGRELPPEAAEHTPWSEGPPPAEGEPFAHEDLVAGAEPAEEPPADSHESWPEPAWPEPAEPVEEAEPAPPVDPAEGHRQRASEQVEPVDEPEPAIEQVEPVDEPEPAIEEPEPAIEGPLDAPAPDEAPEATTPPAADEPLAPVVDPAETSPTAAEPEVAEADRQPEHPEADADAEHAAAAEIDSRYDAPAADQPGSGDHTYEYEVPATVSAENVADGPRGPALPPIAAEHARAGRPPRRRSVRRIVGLSLLLIVLVVVLVLAAMIWQPFKGEGSGSVVVRIPQGATAGEIGDLLAAKDVVSNGAIFGLRARLSSKRTELKAGRFTLKHDMSYSAAIEALTKNPKTAPTFDITIPEGRAISEVAPVVSKAGVSGSYRAAAQPRRRNALLDRLGAPRAKRSLEGLLYPSTYELRRGATATVLVSRQLQAFRQAFSPTQSQARASCAGQKLSAYEVVIVASMVEREASVPRERDQIAGVICNRLRRDMPLGIDATIRYAVDNWSRPLRQSELSRDTAYNTRLHAGLPPGPIGSPGSASLKAALLPAKTDALYYVVKPCGKGAHAFSSTEAQFTRDVAAYERKRTELGGKDPRVC